MSASSRSVALHEANAISPNSRTDWERIRREAAADTPIPYDPNSPDDGPCNPNDPTAESHWRPIKRPVEVALEAGDVTRGIGKDAVVFKPEDLGFNK